MYGHHGIGNKYFTVICYTSKHDEMSRIGEMSCTHNCNYHFAVFKVFHKLLSVRFTEFFN